MLKLVFCFLLVAVALASAGFVAYSPAYYGAGAYGHHGPFAVSYNARVDAPRQDLISYATLPYAYHHYSLYH